MEVKKKAGFVLDVIVKGSGKLGEEKQAEAPFNVIFVGNVDSDSVEH